MTAQSPAQSPHKVAQGLAHTVCPPLKGDTLCALGAETLCTDPAQPARHVTTGRIVINKRLPLDPDIAAWARACRDVFGPGVKLYPDRYAHLWGSK